MTIVEAIKQVMRDRGRPMTVAEVYNAIIGQGLYSFNADQPVQIVRNQIRRHCQGIDVPSASPTKHFIIHSDGTYTALPGPIKHKTVAVGGGKQPRPGDPAAELRALHANYLEEFRKRLVRQLMTLDPAKFELFGMKLLVAYGFTETKVTQVSKDGGIDGYGKLSLGLGSINVAFQCKRWKKTPVSRPMLSQFRGDIQGKYELGIYFTTGTFTKDAQQAASQPGAVPIVLLDGRSIANLMMEKHFGVDVESLPIYSNALDNAMSDGA
jgi:restriction system protein